MSRARAQPSSSLYQDQERLGQLLREGRPQDREAAAAEPSPVRPARLKRFYCAHCSRVERAEVPPAGWLRVQVSDPETAASRSPQTDWPVSPWTIKGALGLLCSPACLAAAATAAAKSEAEAG